MNPSGDVTFLVPARNESASLRATVEAIRRVAGRRCREILVILAPDAPSATRQTAERLVAEHAGVVRAQLQQGVGLGRAVAEGFALASAEYVLLMAADLETDPEAIPGFLEKMGEGCWDIVAGSRWLPGGGFEHYGWCKRCANRMFQWFVGRLYGARLTDLTYAYRLYRRKALEGIVWDETGHAMLLECLLKPLRLGVRVGEVPCRWRRRDEGAGGPTWRQGWRYLRLAVRVRLAPIERWRAIDARSGRSGD